MDKATADKKIFEYRDRIFGFALDKVRNIDQAQTRPYRKSRRVCIPHIEKCVGEIRP